MNTTTTRTISRTTSATLLTLALVLSNTATAQAASQDLVTNADFIRPIGALGSFYDLNEDLAVLDIPLVNIAEIASETAEEAAEEEIKEEEPKIVVHTVGANESLSSISEEYDTDWLRIFAKNAELESPDYLEEGDKLTIPAEDEELELRELPQPAPAPVPVAATVAVSEQPTATQSAVIQTAARQVASQPAPSGGNTYYAGYCTWYSKSRRPDLPNSLGNADTWLARAAAQGYATGSAPRAGAIAYALTGYMHVAYVESVNSDGTVNLSEMNYAGYGVVSTRTAPANQFSYIY